MVERRSCKFDVVGSIPIPPAKKKHLKKVKKKFLIRRFFINFSVAKEAT